MIRAGLPSVFGLGLEDGYVPTFFHYLSLIKKPLVLTRVCKRGPHWTEDLEPGASQSGTYVSRGTARLLPEFSGFW